MLLRAQNWSIQSELATAQKSKAAAEEAMAAHEKRALEAVIELARTQAFQLC